MLWDACRYIDAVIDSRKVQKGSLFFALRGEKFDGHAFLKDVAQKGAVAAVVEEGYQGEAWGLSLIRVKNVLKALQDEAQRIVSERGTRIVAVTGSVGKTTTKEFIAALLKTRYRIHKSPGNANSQVGVPLTILNSKGDEELLILEMGMNHAGEISRLIEIAPPEVVAITKIGLAHAEFFPNGKEGIAAAKAEIFSHIKTRLGIVPIDACQYPSILETGVCPRFRFALNSSDAEYTLLVKENEIFISENHRLSPPIQLPFSMDHFLENFLLATAVARAFDVSWEQIQKAALCLGPYQMRFEKIEKEGITFINDSYNASPESMRAALQNLPKPKEKGRTIAIFGEMKELGLFSANSHREIAFYALPKVDALFCFGNGCLPMLEVFKERQKEVHFFTDFQELKKEMRKFISSGDVVLLKGSNSNQLWRLLED